MPFLKKVSLHKFSLHKHAIEHVSLAGPPWTPKGWGFKLAVSPPELTVAAALHDDSSKSSKPLTSKFEVTAIR